MEYITKKQCNGCMACLNVCHTEAIVVEKDEYGFYVPHINESACINCRACIRACPLNDSNMKDIYIDKEEFIAFAAQNKNQETRLQSSSGGGIFTIGRRGLDGRRYCLWSGIYR